MHLTTEPLWQFILGLGLTGSIVAAVASMLNDRFRRRFELQKWRAEFYVEPKLKALRTLHAAMVNSHYEINMRAKALMPQTAEEYRENVERPAKRFFKALTMAEIYLDDDTQKAMRTVLGNLRQMTTSISLRLPDILAGRHEDAAIREPDWQPFSRSFDDAHNRLRRLLHPGELIKWVEHER